MNDLAGKIEESYQFIKEKIDFVPQVGIILGTGFGSSSR